jgi:formylglycine-generating enzyme required for sulfatase activity
MIEPHYIFDAPAELKRLSEMIFVEGGTFRMGSEDDDEDALDWEKPAHDVKVDSFYIGKYPVTQALWKAIMNGDNPSRFIGDDLPVEGVSWDKTQVFIKKLHTLTNKVYRLPTEAEWEYAAKGGQYFKDFPFKYAGSNKPNEVGWYNENNHGETKPVGLKFSNFLGIYDMSGNVFEWCYDKINRYEGYKNVIEQSKKDEITGILLNPTGIVVDMKNKKKTTSSELLPDIMNAIKYTPDYPSRVTRGGFVLNGEWLCSSQARGHYDPTKNTRAIGFRLVSVPLSI